MIYFKRRMLLFAIIMITHAVWFYRNGYVPSEIEAVILITIYLGFTINGIGVE